MTQSWLRRKASRLIQRAIHVGALLTRPLTLGVRVAVFDHDGKVLLVRHGYMPGWHFPGGGIEPGETALFAMTRELREEARIEVAGPARLHGVFLNRRRDHIAVYVVRAFQSLGERTPDWEIREVGFFAPATLPEGTSPGTRRRLVEILEGAPSSETW